MQSICRQFSSSGVRRVFKNGEFPPSRALQRHPIPPIVAPRQRSLFSSNASLQEEASVKVDIPKELPHTQKRKHAHLPAGKTSLRRVAVEAQRSREHFSNEVNENGPKVNTEQARHTGGSGEEINRVTAVSVADQFDMNSVASILRSHGFHLDPDGTGFETDQVIHTRGVNNGDIFVFPSGTLVAWSLSEDVVFDLATKTLLPTAVRPHMDQMEMEDLEYAEDNKRESSGIKGEVITLGTKDKRPGGKLK